MTRISRSSTLPVPLLFLALVCTLQPASGASISGRDLEPVNADLAVGKADDAMVRLNSSLAANPEDAQAHNLLCQVYYQEERWDNAIRECQTAVRLMPRNSEYHLWLGRAYGEKANSIHSVKAYDLAKKVRDEFKQAVQLDGTNVDALSDLGEFYAASPRIAGGGKKKARDVAQVLEQYEPAEAYELKARLAEKDKNYALAQTEFKAAIGASSEPAGAWMALASFYSRRRRWDKMLAALHAGVDADAKAAKPNGPALVDGAVILTHNKREPQLAIEMLKLYLASPNKSADWPAFQVHAQLSQLLEQVGDEAGARQQIEAATALAREYHPAALRTFASDQ